MTKIKLKKKVVLSGLIGNVMEFYDFSLYGILSATLAKVFFETGDPFVSLMVSLTVFASGLFMRPLGGLFFGHLGDRFGRKRALTLSIIAMAFPTLIISLLPSYAQIGLVAPLILCLCRLVQGFCAGGEGNGSAVFLIEHSEDKHAGLAGSLTLVGSAFGTVLSMGSAYLVLRPGMPGWAWRVPFFLGTFVAIVGFYMRHNLKETPVFEKLQSQHKIVRFPLKEVLKNSPKVVICTMGVAGFGGSLAYSLVVYLGLHLNRVLRMEMSSAILYGAFGWLLYSLLLPIAGHLSDRFGWARMMMIGSGATFCLIYPLFNLLQTGSRGAVIGFIVVLVILMSLFNGPKNAFLNHIFPVKYRYTGIAVSYSVGIAAFGGLMPLISTMLVRVTGNPLAPAFYIMMTSLMGILAVSYGKEKAA